MPPTTHIDHGIEQVQALLSLARDLIQVDEPSQVLKLTGAALVEVVGARCGLLLMTGDLPLCAAFSAQGQVQAATPRHPLYRAARARLVPGACAPADPGMLVSLIPATQPFAALLAVFPAGVQNDSLSNTQLALDALLELASATLGRIGVRQSLEQMVTTQYAQMAGSAQEYADELARRDAQARDMLAVSLTDVLTGLNNRRGFFARAEPLFRLAQRQHAASAVIYADIDGLKHVNDTQGHAVGDEMIGDAAAVLRASVRDADVLARLGGDEFVAFAVVDSAPQALLSRLESNLHAFNLSGRRPYQLSLSVGMVECDPDGRGTLDDSVQKADRAMYEHKRRRLH